MFSKTPKYLIIIAIILIGGITILNKLSTDSLAGHPDDLNTELISFSAEFTNTSNEPVQPNSSVFDKPTGTAGRVLINIGYYEEGVFENGVIRITNSQMPGVMSINDIHIDPDYVAAKELDQDGTIILTLGAFQPGQYVAIPISFTNIKENFMTKPGFLTGDVPNSPQSWSPAPVLSPVLFGSSSQATGSMYDGTESDYYYAFFGIKNNMTILPCTYEQIISFTAVVTQP